MQQRASLARLSGSFALAAAILVSSALAPSELRAQSTSPPTRNELLIGDVLPEDRSQSVSLTVRGDIERGPCPFADPDLADTKITFSTVTFANIEELPPSILLQTWREHAGREVPIASLCTIRDSAATLLRQMGYLAAVQIPPQRIDKNGEVRMDILAAKLVEVQVRGNVGPNEGLIAAHVSRLTNQGWFNVKRSERQLLLMNDLPGHDVILTLRPANREPGEVIGDVVVKRRPIEVSAGIQNLGSKFAGRWGVFSQVVLNGIIGTGDRTSFSIFNTLETSEQTILQLNHEMALGSDGLRLGGTFVYGRSKLGGSVGPFKTETVLGNVAISYPLRRTQAFSLHVAGGFDLIEQDVDFGSVLLTRDKLRVFYGRLGLDASDRDSLSSIGGYSASEPKWRVRAMVEARQGMNGLGASKGCTPLTNCRVPNVPISNLLADPSAFVLRAQARAEFRPVPELTLAVAPRLQYSGDALLSFEQFSLGNYTIGRGLDPGIVLGDSGLGASFEVRYGRLIPRSPEEVTLQPFLFLDSAWSWLNDGGLTDDPHRVISAGGGIRARWGNRFDTHVVLAAPLKRTDTQTKRGDVRLLFTIRARLVPWKRS